jgi:coniferyl-aldehyde dehydrogenase
MNVVPRTESSISLDQRLARQRSAFLRDGPPSLRQRRADLKKLRAAILARRSQIEDALDTRRRVALEFWFGSARIEYQPLGVVGIMAPWNFPLS